MHKKLNSKEKWEPIISFPSYSISSLGQVRNDKTKNIFLGTITKHGYRRVQLYRAGKPYSVFVHRLVGEAFLPNLEGKPQINHKDGDKINNQVENLEWCTAHENSLHKYRVVGVKPYYHPPVNPKPVLCVETGVVYPSAKEAARKTGLHQGNISGVARGERKSAGGRTWVYV